MTRAEPKFIFCPRNLCIHMVQVNNMQKCISGQMLKTFKFLHKQLKLILVKYWDCFRFIVPEQYLFCWKVIRITTKDFKIWSLVVHKFQPPPPPNSSLRWFKQKHFTGFGVRPARFLIDLSLSLGGPTSTGHIICFIREFSHWAMLCRDGGWHSPGVMRPPWASSCSGSRGPAEGHAWVTTRTRTTARGPCLAISPGGDSITYSTLRR